MGKSSDYKKRANDAYYTPKAAVLPLVGNIDLEYFRYCEPCAGNGQLIENIRDLFDGSACMGAYDIDPQGPDIISLDARHLVDNNVRGCDYIITNPPWTRTKASGYLMHELIEVFSDLRPTWLLLDVDWMHTKQSSDLIKTRLKKIVSIGRVQWIVGSKSTGTENSAWYLFDGKKPIDSAVEFVGR